MKFKSNSVLNAVAIGTLTVGDTFIDLKNFSESEVFMIVTTNGYDCHVEFFDDDTSEIAVVNLTSGELWSYEPDEKVIQVEMEEVIYNR